MSTTIAEPHMEATDPLEASSERRPRRVRRRRRPRFNFVKQMAVPGTVYDTITSIEYLNFKYGLRKSHYIKKFIKCIHRKINEDVSKINDKYVEELTPWVKVKLFMLLVTLSERGGPEYWFDKNETDKDKNQDENETVKEERKKDQGLQDEDKDIQLKTEQKSSGPDSSSGKKKGEVNTKVKLLPTLTEYIMQQNINQEFSETTYDENYVFSSIWANFMEGLINYYLEKVIVPHSEMKVCQQLYKPMMKIISLYNEYNELMEKSERNGFLPKSNGIEDLENEIPEGSAKTEKEASDEIVELSASLQNVNLNKADNIVAQERLQRAQKLLWQARQDIPKTISKELTLLSEMYSTLSADEQDYELDEFVCCAEEYIELEYLPNLVDILFDNCGSNDFWKIMLVLEPFFYYIEEVNSHEDEEDDEYEDRYISDPEGTSQGNRQSFKPDPRVITLEKICEVAARQKWI
ncbi:hypothetical protein RNJ44_04284 [Nakaseomyces bracarensis]|uniref:Uncharacterized protein n=1 Tax=Nakaseomyces bracarensis TaxID=273131 RepID=A0ABR4NUK8_9SACH